jgi:GT2 family glycosyltransferase
MNQPIDIVMVTWNRPEITERSIRAIAKNTTTPSRLIVVDNGSSNPMRVRLRELQEQGFIHQLVELEENVGLEPAKNHGMQFVESELFVSTDNDILPMEPDTLGDWLSKLVTLMEQNPGYGAIASRTQVMIGTGNIFFGHEDDGIIEFPHPGGSLRIMRTDAVRRVGGWRQDVTSRGAEERYICGKLREVGYLTGFAVKVKCYHMFGADANWGYGDVHPTDHGHNPIWHPAIVNGDNEERITEWLSA